MPELFSRMDNAHWLTPAIADILDQGATPPGGDGSIREIMLTIQRELTDYETPARIVNVRSTPSYTLVVTRPENVGRLGSRRLVTGNEIKRSVGKMSEAHPEWTLGFMPRLSEDESAVGILLRTEEHQPISLRRLLVRNSFRKHPTNTGFVCGATLDQQLVIRDLTEIGHLFLLGGESARENFLRTQLLTLLLLNTPGELRLAIAGTESPAFENFIQSPHALGRLLPKQVEAQRLLEGLAREVKRRRQAFTEENTRDLDTYNIKQREQNKADLPRILFVIDPVDDPQWQSTESQWLPLVTTLLRQGAPVGIHLVLGATKSAVPVEYESLLAAVRHKIIFRSEGKALIEQIQDFHPSLIRFIDFFVTDGDGAAAQIVPVETCAVTDDEILRAVEYWRSNAQQRQQETQETKISGTTGVTGLLDTEKVRRALQTPPTPPPPSPEQLARVTEALGGQPANRAEAVISTGPAEASESLATGEMSISSEFSPQSADGAIQTQATALAAYLGWLGVGPLCDIFGLSADEARNVLHSLQESGILEATSSPTPRFIPPRSPGD